MESLPKKVAQFSEHEDKLPQAIAEMPQEQEEPETVPYVISFLKYNHKMSEIGNLGRNKGKKAIKILKDIGTKICCKADYQRCKIDRIPVRNEGEYKKLYNKLGEDIEIKEIKLQGRARIFYYDVESEKKFYVVSIRENHLETKKVRR
jgi:hypothetical protein